MKIYKFCTKGPIKKTLQSIIYLKIRNVLTHLCTVFLKYGAPKVTFSTQFSRNLIRFYEQIIRNYEIFIRF
jgi:hypothetical protein